jgi:hypothetical protein
MLRGETEREFATTRLPTLQIEWRLSGVYSSSDGGSVTSGGILGFSDNGAFATFSAMFDGPACERRYMENRLEASAREENVTRALRYSDLDLHYRIPPGGVGTAFTTQQCLLDGVCNDVQIPSLTVDLDASTFTFEWRRFMDDFYRDSVYVQRREHLIEASQHQDSTLPDSGTDSVDDSLAAHFHEWSTCTASVEGGGKCPKSGSMLEQPLSWSEKIGAESDGLYTEAYLHRLKRSFAYAGQILDFEHVAEGTNAADLRHWAGQNVAGHRRRRNALLFQDYTQRHGIHPCISDNGTFIPLFCSCNSSGSPRYSPISPHFSPLEGPYSRADCGFWLEVRTPERHSRSLSWSPESPASLGFPPSSPDFAPASPQQVPSSPQYSPDSPWYSRSSPRYSPASPTAPRWSPTSPRYSPTSPQYSPASPRYATSLAPSCCTPTSPQYPPTWPFGGSTEPPSGVQFPPPNEPDSIMRDDTSYYDPSSDDENCGVDMSEDQAL